MARRTQKKLDHVGTIHYTVFNNRGENIVNLFDLTPEQMEIMERRDKLLDKQEALTIHHYRTESTVLTDDDREYDRLRAEIDKLNAQIYS